MKNINEFPVQDTFPIRWGDMDAFYHVNNVVFLRYFENAITKYFHEIGLFELQKKTGIGPVMVETKCRYFQSLTYPDNITVGAKVNSVGETSLIMEYLIVSEKMGVAAAGEGVLVTYNFNTSQKVSVPDEIRIAIKNLEKRTAAL